VGVLVMMVAKICTELSPIAKRRLAAVTGLSASMEELAALQNADFMRKSTYLFQRLPSVNTQKWPIA
jgi:hypothetical protein